MFNRTWFRDTTERVLASGLLGFLVLLTSGDALNISALEGAAVAGGLAAASALKATIAAMLGQKGTASLDPGLATVTIEPDVAEDADDLPHGG